MMHVTTQSEVHLMHNFPTLTLDIWNRTKGAFVFGIKANSFWTKSKL